MKKTQSTFAEHLTELKIQNDKINAIKESILEEEKKLTQQLKEYNALILPYTIFPLDVLGGAIGEVLALYEVDEFAMEEDPLSTGEYFFTTHVLGKMVPEMKVQKRSNVSVIMKRYWQRVLCDIQIFDILLENGESIELQYYESTTGRFVKTYKENPQDGLIYSTIQCGNYPYIMDFINDCIEYRIENEIKTVHQEEMTRMLHHFLTHKKENIKNYIQKKNQERIETFQSHWKEYMLSPNPHKEQKDS